MAVAQLKDKIRLQPDHNGRGSESMGKWSGEAVWIREPSKVVQEYLPVLSLRYSGFGLVG